MYEFGKVLCERLVCVCGQAVESERERHGMVSFDVEMGFSKIEFQHKSQACLEERKTKNKCHTAFYLKMADTSSDERVEEKESESKHASKAHRWCMFWFRIKNLSSIRNARSHTHTHFTAENLA